MDVFLGFLGVGIFAFLMLWGVSLIAKANRCDDSLQYYITPNDDSEKATIAINPCRCHGKCCGEDGDEDVEK